ncbi:uncharacterized protein LOC124651713 [Lolium rigidum]|uniref:uncharacterized protein LOC124651713 n=1 Tax=Lolium rigidum TaxID=89674 RepID=UPI001F5E1AA9|nr:uncharacterized protein LOC124651713 [Lolium rigidum]
MDTTKVNHGNSGLERCRTLILDEARLGFGATHDSVPGSHCPADAAGENTTTTLLLVHGQPLARGVEIMATVMDLDLNCPPQVCNFRQEKTYLHSMPRDKVLFKKAP